MHNNNTIFHRIFHKIWTLFLSGLFALLPLTLTIAVFSLTFRLIHGWLEPLKRLNIPFLATTPYSEFLLAILIIFAAGMLYNIFILGPIVTAIENIIVKLPLVSSVYSGIKQLVHAFSSQDKVSFSKVVMVEFPRPGIYSIGFLASEVETERAPQQHQKYFNIFIPTTPNPTTGFLILVPEHEIIPIDISRQDAMAMIISGGIIQPNIIKKDVP